MLSINQLSFKVGNQRITVDQMELHQGTINAIVGKNNSGKTSFCEALTYSRKAETVLLNNKPFLSRQFIYMEASCTQFLGVTGKDLIYGNGGGANLLMIKDLAEIFNIPLEMPVSSYTLSMKKLIQFLWILSYNVDVYIFDGLLELLDPDNKALVKNALQHLKDQSRIIILTTTSSYEVEDIADTVYFLNKKNMEMEARYSEIFNKAG
jgi:ABC-type multidrug transport system ATPase subunit